MGPAQHIMAVGEGLHPLELYPRLKIVFIRHARSHILAL
jgi:hypothetical protein